MSCIASIQGWSATYFVDSLLGDDANDGLSTVSAWKTIDKINATLLSPGDNVRFKANQTIAGKLYLTLMSGTDLNPIVIDSYGGTEGSKAIIDGSGYRAAIHIDKCSYITLQNLEVINGHEAPAVSYETSAETKRAGVLVGTWGVAGYRGIVIDNLYIHNIYHEFDTNGIGIDLNVANNDTHYLEDVTVSNCTIEDTALHAIQLVKWKGDSIEANRNIQIINNTISYVGGAGILLGRAVDSLVSGNIVNYSGANTDPRMLARGSGLWTWFCSDTIAEYNHFSHARGILDSCGMHIDIGNHNVIYQYNFSKDNEGGFVEILGDSTNCVYRYNISVNDGARVKGVNGAQHNGCTFWLGGYTGNGTPKSGPFNSYIYNNTIYVDASITSRYDIEHSAKGAYFANNLICVEGATVDDTDETTVWPWFGEKHADIYFTHNRFVTNTVPNERAWDFFTDNSIVTVPEFLNYHGVLPEDYISLSKTEILNQGTSNIVIPGDTIGVVGGLRPMFDANGNEILQEFDIGAYEWRPYHVESTSGIVEYSDAYLHDGYLNQTNAIGFLFKTKGITQTGGDTGEIVLDQGSIKTINTVDFQTADGGTVPNAIEVLVSDDNLTYQTLFSDQVGNSPNNLGWNWGDHWSKGQSKISYGSTAFNPTSARYIKVRVTAWTRTDWAFINATLNEITINNNSINN